MNKFEKLDLEHRGRIDEIAKAWHKGGKLKTSDIFHSTTILSSLEKPKIILNSFKIPRILANYPFAHRLYATLCPYCLGADEAAILRDVLLYSDVVPVLIAAYTEYPPEILRVLLQFPHINRHEFMFFRYARVLSIGSGQRVCDHCVKEREQLIAEDAKRLGLPPRTTKLVGRCLHNLYPFIKPDYELVTTLVEVVKKNDMAAFAAIVGTSEMIGKLRTSQAYNARSLLPIRDIPQLITGARDVVPDADETEFTQISEVVSSPLILKVGANVSRKDFFMVANEHRHSLASVVDRIIEESTDDGGLALGKLSDCMASLNAELQSLRTNKRYLGYKAALGFLSANKVLVASTLVAGALGLAGSAWGCGASVVSGFGAKMGIRKLRQMGRLRPSPETKAFLGQVKASLRPKLHRLLASYTGILISL